MLNFSSFETVISIALKINQMNFNQVNDIFAIINLLNFFKLDEQII